MMMNAFRAGACAFLGLMLAACDGGSADALEPPPGSIQIACAISGEQFGQRCFVEQSDTAEGLLLTVRQPDGGFRRLRVTQDGAGVTAADGAEPAEVTQRSQSEVEVTIGGARYRLPAQLLAGKRA